MKNFIQKFFSAVDKNENKTQIKMNEINVAICNQVKYRMRQANAKRKGYELISENDSKLSCNYDEDENENENEEDENGNECKNSNDFNTQSDFVSTNNITSNAHNFPNQLNTNLEKMLNDDLNISSKFKTTITINKYYRYDQKEEGFDFNLNEIETKLKEKSLEQETEQQPSIDFLNSSSSLTSSRSSTSSSCSSSRSSSNTSTPTNISINLIKHIPRINISLPPPPSSRAAFKIS